MTEPNNIPHDKFKVGDVVVLRSGGPKMTIRESSTESEDGTITVNWFTVDTLVFEYLHEDQVELAPPKETP